MELTKLTKIPGALLTLFLVLPSTAVEAALQPVIGNGLVLNDVGRNASWTQDANLFKTLAANYLGGANEAAFVSEVIGAVAGVVNDTPNALDNPVAGSGQYYLSSSDFSPSTGTMSWWGAQAWVGYLNHINYGGVTGWRLPTAGRSSTGELEFLFSQQLSNPAGPPPGPGFNLISNFVESRNYWSGTEWIANAGGVFTSDPSYAWAACLHCFTAFDITISNFPKTMQFQAWAIRDGQVSAVPLPTAIWLLGSSLICIVGTRQSIESRHKGAIPFKPVS